MRSGGFRTASPKDLFMLSRAISHAVHSLDVEVARLRDELAKPRKATYVAASGLLTSFREEVMSPTKLAAVEAEALAATEAEIARRVREVEAQLAARHPLISSLGREPMYEAMQLALERQASRRKGRFADPRAKLMTLDSTLAALGQWRHYQDTGTKPNPPAADDWRAAIDAVETLMRLEKMGVPVASAFAGRLQLGVPWDWLSRLHRGLKAAKRSARKPHRDKYVAEREACKAFASSIHARFENTVPPVLVERFGDLIGYQSEKLARVYLKDWVRQFETDALT